MAWKRRKKIVRNEDGDEKEGNKEEKRVKTEVYFGKRRDGEEAED